MKAEQHILRITTILEKEDVIPGIKRIKNKRKGIAAVKQCFSWDMSYLEKEKTPIEITKKLTGEQAVCLVLVCLMLEVDVVAFLSNPQDLIEALKKPTKEEYSWAAYSMYRFIESGVSYILMEAKEEMLEHFFKKI